MYYDIRLSYYATILCLDLTVFLVYVVWMTQQISCTCDDSEIDHLYCFWNYAGILWWELLSNSSIQIEKLKKLTRERLKECATYTVTLRYTAIISLEGRSDNNGSTLGFSTSGEKSDTENLKCTQIRNRRKTEDEKKIKKKFSSKPYKTLAWIFFLIPV